MRQKDIFNRFQQFLSETEGEFQIMEHQVPIETQMEYFKHSNRLRGFLFPLKSEITVEDADYEQFASALENPETSTTDKKSMLSVLAILKQVKAYRILEKFLKSADKELTDWAYMALMESRMALESEFSDGRQIYISTGLGGKGHKFRFYILLLSATGNAFLDYQKQVVEREFAYTLSKEDGEIEQLTVKENYIELLLLVPMQTDIKNILENVITECNQYGNFISDIVTVTNVKKLTDKEIAKIIEQHGNQNNRTGS